jgi:hypothetical protein
VLARRCNPLFEVHHEKEPRQLATGLFQFRGPRWGTVAATDAIVTLCRHFLVKKGAGEQIPIAEEPRHFATGLF